MECFKWGLMGHPSRNVEDIGSKSNLNCGCLVLKVSTEKFFSMWQTECFLDVLVKNVAAFCLYPNSLPETKVKTFIFIALTKDISKKVQYRLCPLVYFHEEHFDQA